MTNATLRMMQFNHGEERVAGACLVTAQHTMVFFFNRCMIFLIHVTHYKNVDRMNFKNSFFF